MDEKAYPILVPHESMTISIIIPCLNEAEFIEKTLNHLISLPGNFEIIVVDGGSEDRTISMVKEFPMVKLISSAKGRGIQMNHGAKIAKGEVLLFLHADTFLPGNAYSSVLAFMQNRKNVGGSFYLILDKDHMLLNFYSWCSKLSLEFFTYGDHGIFIRKTVFEQIGGYKDIPFMEDVEIQKRLRKAGRFKKLNSAVTSSARRFEKTGTARQFFLDLLLILSFKLGVSPVKLKKFYKDHC
jgi:rSAM/selenodomain-associated transferase 2